MVSEYSKIGAKYSYTASYLITITSSAAVTATSTTGPKNGTSSAAAPTGGAEKNLGIAAAAIGALAFSAATAILFRFSSYPCSSW